MKKTIIQILTATMILTGCKSSVEQSDEYFRQQFESKLGDEIFFFTSTVNFYYTNPTNYWYPEEYTFLDIVFEDKYVIGYNGLTSLDEDIHAIPNYDAVVGEAISELEKEISASKKELKKQQNDISNWENIGRWYFSSIMQFASEEERKMIDDEGRAMPENVKVSLENLKNILFSRYLTLANEMYELENGAFEFARPSIDEKSIIRYNLKTLVREKVKLQYNSQDTISRDEMINQIFVYYDKEFKLTNE